MEENGALRASTHESLRMHDNNRIFDVEALRMAIQVLGFILFIPGLIYLVLGIAAIFVNSDYGPEDYRTYLWITQITGIVSAAGAMVVGYLLLRIARRRLAYSVGEIFYPAVTAIGAYLVLLAAVRVMNPIVFHYFAIGDWYPYAAFSVAILGVHQLPYFIGGILFIMIGMRQYPIRR
jgi:hypothetical protein